MMVQDPFEPITEVISSGIVTWSSTTLCDNCQNKFIPSPFYPAVPLSELHSKRVPTATESQQNTQFIEEEYALCARYTEEIDRLRNLADGLEKQRDALWEKIRNRHSWSSAIRRLPVEILHAIFMEVSVPAKGHAPVSLSVFSDPPCGEVVSDPTLRISQVCSRWREVTIASPYLWSSLAVDLYGLQVNITPLIKIHIQNSQDIPLKITLRDMGRDCAIESDVDPEEYLGENGVSVYRTLMGQLDRCSELCLDFQPKLLSIPIHPWFWFNLSFPLLEVFSNELWDEDDIATPMAEFSIDPPRCFRDALRNRAPKLTTAKTYSVTPLTRTMFPCPQLTSLSINLDSHLPPLLDFLAECTNIESLELKDVEFYGTTWNGRLRTREPPLILPSIRTVSLTSQAPYDLSVLLQSITLPNLDNLTLDIPCHKYPTADQDTVNGQPLFHKHFIDFLERSSCTVKTLKVLLGRGDIEEDPYVVTGLSWQRILDACSELTHLSFVQRGRCADPPSLSGLIVALKKTHFGDFLSGSPLSLRVPKLKTLYVRVEGSMSTGCMESYINMLDVRMKVSRGIVCVESTDEGLIADPYVLSVMEQLEKTGNECNFIFN